MFNIRGRRTGPLAAAVLGLSAGGGRPLSQWCTGVLPPENLENFICQIVHFGEYLCDTNWTHFVVVNTDFEAFLNQRFTRELYNVSTVIQICLLTYLINYL